MPNIVSTKISWFSVMVLSFSIIRITFSFMIKTAIVMYMDHMVSNNISNNVF